MPVTPVIGKPMSPIQRGDDDALPRASIGTVPILWTNAAALLAGLRTGAYAGCEDTVRRRLFTELGDCVLDLDGVLAPLVARDYAGWLMVEQDMCQGAPIDSAAMGRAALAASLRRLGGSRRSEVVS